MFMITESAKAVAQYLYAKCDATLSISSTYSDFVDYANSEMSKEQFTKCIWFMIYDGYVTRTSKAFPLKGKEDTNFLVLSSRLIREVEGLMCQPTEAIQSSIVQE